MRNAAERMMLAALLVMAATSVEGRAEQRLAYQTSTGQGLPDGVVLALAQDHEGFVWIGTRGGLARFDGTEARRWAGEEIPRADMIAASPNGEVVAGWSDQALYRVAPGAVRSVVGPGGRQLSSARSPVYLPDGSLWVIASGEVLARDAEGGWISVPKEGYGGQRPRRIQVDRRGRPLLVTDDGVWRLSAHGDPDLVLRHPGIVAVEGLEGDAVMAAEFCCDLFEARDGRTTRRHRLADRTRAIGLATRGEKVWLVHDHGLVALDPSGGAASVQLPSATSLLVDREGSLWVGTRNGVARYPDPETVLWTIADGLPKDVRYLASTREGIWVAATGGLGLMSRGDDGRVLARRALDLMSAFPLCVDGQDRLWSGGGYGDPYRFVVVERSAGAFTVHEFGDLGDEARTFACATAEDGRVWIALGEAIFTTSARGGRPALAASLAGEGVEPLKLLVDSDEYLHAADHGQACRTPAASLRPGENPHWQCAPVGDGGEIYDLEEAAPGEIWAGTTQGGVRRLAGGRIQPPGIQAAGPGSWITGLNRSPRGGVWVMGSGQIRRLVIDGDAWQVAESLSAWNGLPIIHGVDLLEEDDGSLWVTTAEGVLHVPAEARWAHRDPPPVRLTAAHADAGPAAPGSPYDFVYGSGSLTARFAALSFRDPSTIGYRVRHRPDEPWSTSREGIFRYVDLAPGDYRIEAQATIDGVTWSPAPQAVRVRVLAPWYRGPWAVVLFATVGAVIVYGSHRAILYHRLRLERQRVGIAMDLHDELGSGLGSIGILAGVASQEGVPGDVRLDASRRIVQTAGELGTALTDIVWSLNSGPGTIEDLAHHLAERGGRLFAADVPAFTTDFPDAWPGVSLSPAVRRSLQRIGVEAMHNAARHAGAATVRLGLRGHGRRWSLWVTDDGNGLATRRGAEENGVGMAAMERRAKEIGAEISWSKTPGGGTTVTVTFDPGAPGRGGNE